MRSKSCPGYAAANAILVFLILLAGGYAFVLSMDISSTVQHTRELELDRDFSQTVTTLSLLDRDVARLTADIMPLVRMASLLRHTPWIGPVFAALPPFVSAISDGLHLATITASTCQEPLAAIAQKTLTPGQALTPLCQAIMQDSTSISAAASQLAKDCDRLSDIEINSMPQILRAGAQNIQSAASLCGTAAQSLPALASLITESPNQDLLLLVQNSDELRATGGFISAFVAIQIRDGELLDVAFVDNYELEDWDKPHPDAPAILEQEMSIQLLVTRDANWWPDFATSAKQITSLYELNTGIPVHFVAAIDTTAAIRLVDTMAPITLESGNVLQRGQIREALEQSWGLPADALLVEGVEIAAQQAYDAVQVNIVVENRTGEMWFDDILLYRNDAPDNNLIRNASFEQDIDQDRLPDFWEASSLQPLDGISTETTRSGGHSLHISGQLDKSSSLSQLISVAGNPGDVFYIEGYSSALDASIAEEPYALEISFLLGDTVVQKTTLSFPPWSHDWAMCGTLSVVANWWDHRKDIINDTFSALSARAQDPRNVPWLALVGEVEALFDEKHIQLYAATDLQRLFESRDWTGSLHADDSAFLAIVDSNVGYNKVNVNIKQSITYALNVDTGIVRVAINYENTSPPDDSDCDKYRQYLPAYENLTQGCYWNYVRIYAPSNARLTDTFGWDSAISQTLYNDDLTEFAGTLMLEPGQQRTVEITYALPTEFWEAKTLNVTIRKQAGSLAIPLQVEVSSSHPLHSDQTSVNNQSGRLVWETLLLTDRTMTISQ